MQDQLYLLLVVDILWGMENVEKYNNNGGTLLRKVMCLQLTLYVRRKIIIVISKLQKICVLQGTLQMSLSLRRYLPPPIE